MPNVGNGKCTVTSSGNTVLNGVNISATICWSLSKKRNAANMLRTVGLWLCCINREQMILWKPVSCHKCLYEIFKGKKASFLDLNFIRYHKHFVCFMHLHSLSRRCYPVRYGLEAHWWRFWNKWQWQCGSSCYLGRCFWLFNTSRNSRILGPQNRSREMSLWRQQRTKREIGKLWIFQPKISIFKHLIYDELWFGNSAFLSQTPQPTLARDTFFVSRAFWCDYNFDFFWWARLPVHGT